MKAKRKRWKDKAPLGVVAALALASPVCGFCGGSGEMPWDYCACVYRRAFRECLIRYWAIEAGFASWTCSRDGASTWGYRGAEYAADFVIAARRALDAEGMRLFVLYFIQHADWRACAKKLRMDRGQLFHALYRMEALLGRAFLETRPYSIYPRAYFSGRCFADGQFPQRSSDGTSPSTRAPFDPLCRPTEPELTMAA